MNVNRLEDIVIGMQDGDSKTLEAFIQTLGSINQYVYEDRENRLNLLHLATGIESEHRETIIELLIEHRADLNYPGRSEGINGVRALHLAAMWGHDLTVKLLLYHGADASLRDSEGMSPMDYANNHGNYLCISLLIRYGCLNSTSSAWSAVMNSSLAPSDADSSIDSCLDLTSLYGTLPRILGQATDTGWSS